MNHRDAQKKKDGAKRARRDVISSKTRSKRARKASADVDSARFGMIERAKSSASLRLSMMMTNTAALYSHVSTP